MTLLKQPPAIAYYLLLLAAVGLLAAYARRVRACAAALGGALVGNQFLLKVVSELVNCAMHDSYPRRVSIPRRAELSIP